MHHDQKKIILLCTTHSHNAKYKRESGWKSRIEEGVVFIASSLDNSSDNSPFMAISLIIALPSYI
jgi:hypothetical protein